MRSGKPEAPAFQQWVASVVLPLYWRGTPVAPKQPKASTGTPIVPAPPAAPQPLTVHEIEGEPLVLDTDLAEALGFDRPRVIRQLIERNRDELEGYGGLQWCAANPGPLGGRPGRAYYLNEEQALLICMLSRTPRAKAIRAEVIRVYQAWRKGKLVAPQAPVNLSGPELVAMALVEANAMLNGLREERDAALARAEVAEVELNNVTVDEWRSLNHLYLTRVQKQALGRVAARLARERGIKLTKQVRVLNQGTQWERTVHTNEYPRPLLDDAASLVLD